jgi:hypothetical protein
MKRLIILVLFLLVSCTVSQDYNSENYDYLPIDFEAAHQGDVVYEFVKSIETIESGKAIVRDDYLVKNPTSNAKLDVSVFYEKEKENLPVLFFIQGGLGAKEDSLESGPFLDPEGFALVIFSPDGRGNSEGVEDYNGYVQQDGFYEVYKFGKSLDFVDEDKVGVVSLSYGVALASGMLGRYQIPLDYYIEWEGPVNRQYVTAGCDEAEVYLAAWPRDVDCNDDEYWQEREALRFVPGFNVNRFLILQSREDHVQSSWMHSLEMNNLALEHLDWVKVNDGEVNVEYEIEDFASYNEDLDLKDLILDYAQEFSN